MESLDHSRGAVLGTRHGLRLMCALLLAGLALACAAPGQDAGERTRVHELSEARKATHESRWKDAASMWHDIFMRADENSREACAETARALIELHDPASAQHLVELGLRTVAGDSGLFELKAQALEAQGLQRAAETAYENALRFAPDQDRLSFELARLRCDLGMYELALKVLLPRLESGKGSAGEFFLAGKVYKELKRPAQAYVSFERAFAQSPPTVSQLCFAASMYADATVRKQDARAATLASNWSNQALALDPQATTAHVTLGMLAEDAQHDSQAAECYRRAVETDPACLVALSSLAVVQQRRGELESSKAMAERALGLEQDPTKRAELEKLAHPN